MKQLISNVHSFLMIDNKHEEDSEEYVYVRESVVDQLMCKASIGIIAIMMLLGCILR